MAPNSQLHPTGQLIRFGVIPGAWAGTSTVQRAVPTGELIRLSRWIPGKPAQPWTTYSFSLRAGQTRFLT